MKLCLCRSEPIDFVPRDSYDCSKDKMSLFTNHNKHVLLLPYCSIPVLCNNGKLIFIIIRSVDASDDCEVFNTFIIESANECGYIVVAGSSRLEPGDKARCSLLVKPGSAWIHSLD